MHYLIAIWSETNIAYKHAHTHKSIDPPDRELFSCMRERMCPSYFKCFDGAHTGETIHFSPAPHSTHKANKCVAFSNRRPNVNRINGRNENLWFNIKIYFIQVEALKFPHIFR